MEGRRGRYGKYIEVNPNLLIIDEDGTIGSIQDSKPESKILVYQSLLGKLKDERYKSVSVRHRVFWDRTQDNENVF